MGDMTAHGGSIVVGCPTVLINGQPAARQGDMHVCPMVNPGTPPTPHVGGPVAMGAPTVLIGGVPAARMGDMCICAGPPDTIALGSPNVLIGGGGGGGAGGGGAGGGGGGGQAGTVAAAEAQATAPEETELRSPFASLVVTDTEDTPLPLLPFRLKDASGQETPGTLPGGGHVRRNLTEEGSLTFTGMIVLGAEWSTDEAQVGEEVSVSCKAIGFEDGTPALVSIKKTSQMGEHTFTVAQIPTDVRGETVEATWAYEAEPVEDRPGGASAARAETDWSAETPAYIAEVMVEGCPQKSATGLLEYSATLVVEFQDDNDEPVARAPYRIRLANGEIRSGKADRDGRAELDNVPPGSHRLV